MQGMIGSISEGTMRPEDLIPTFTDELERLDGSHNLLVRDSRELMRKVAEEKCNCIAATVTYKSIWEINRETEAMETVLDELFSILNEYAPPYCYFGASEGDGSSYGYWIDHCALDDAIYEGVSLNDGRTSIDDGNYVVEINDHGSIKLYEVPTTVGPLVWAVV